jgi:flavin reductase (DIM6/NTAB) family NADH-FMN oxidoreductase RutF
MDEEARENLAPFSYYQAVCSSPPTVVLAISWHPDGRPKDTLANLLATHELCISHVTRADAERMNRTSASLPHDVSEWARFDVAQAASRTIRPPRVASALAAFECRLVHALPLGRGAVPGAPSSTLVIAEIQHVVLRKGLLARDARGRILPMDPTRLEPVGRLGGIAYTDATGRFELPRPEEITR